MGLPPTGEIIARPMVTRACGHACEFQHYAVDKYRAQRLAKFQKSRCPTCVAELEEQQRKAAVPRGEAFKLLPAGAAMSLTLRPDGAWAGTLAAGGRTVKADGDAPPAVALVLARMWLAGRPDA